MMDTHIHIGQFYEKYYAPVRVLDIVFQAGVDEVFFSSTTSGKAGVLYTKVEREIEQALRCYPTEKAHPLFWCVPEYAQQGVNVERAMQNLPYSGLKLHPRAQHWDLANRNTVKLLQDLFEYANEKALPVLIHTGHDKIDEARRFSGFFNTYPKARFILAHARPLRQTMDLLKKHHNVFCDTAFVTNCQALSLAKGGFTAKILPGSDFPITHYYSNRNVSLVQQYKIDFKQLESYQAIIRKLPGVINE